MERVIEIAPILRMCVRVNSARQTHDTAKVEKPSASGAPGTLMHAALNSKIANQKKRPATGLSSGL